MTTSTNSAPLVLVTGITGNQGGAVARRLLANGKTRVRGLSRNLASPASQALAARGVDMVKGDLDDPAALAAALEGVSGVFSVQNFWTGGVETEVRQGVALADAALTAKTPHFVYSSVDGAERQSGVPHFESKGRIERHIAKIGLNATILRPTAFMDGLLGPAFARGAFLSMLRAHLGDSKSLQMVATDDIGWFGAAALEQPALFAGRAIALAGDELRVPEMIAAFRRVGQGGWSLPLPKFATRWLPGDLGAMLAWFGTHGYRADIAALRREHPGLLDLNAFLSARK